MPYTIEEHQHRECAWAAATSARASKLCRFPVEVGADILERSGFDAAFSTPDKLPQPEEMDEAHLGWRNKVIAVAAERHDKTFTHGIAAKLINCYLKARFVCANHHDHERVKALHPPIDAILLKQLGDLDIGGFRKEWRKAHTAAWSKFDSGQYQHVIDLIRKVSGNKPLWMIEEHWQGFQ